MVMRLIYIRLSKVVGGLAGRLVQLHVVIIIPFVVVRWFVYNDCFTGGSWAVLLVA